MDVEFPAQQHEQEANDYHSCRPDVGGEVQGIGFQGLAVEFVGDPPQGARAPPVDAHGKKHDSKGRERRLDFYAQEKHAQNGLVDYPDASNQKQTGLDEGRKILYLAMAILMVGVGRLVGDAYGKESDQGRNQVEAGVRGFGKNAETAGGDSHRDLEAGNDDGSEDGISGSGALFRAHRFR